MVLAACKVQPAPWDFRYLPAPFNQNIWLPGVETMRPIISEGTPKSFAIRPMDSVALIDMAPDAIVAACTPTLAPF